jgi:hypothetical protein
MRTSWTVSGLTLAAAGVVVLAVALGALGFAPTPMHVALGEVGGALLAIGVCILFFEWKDHR